MLLPDHTRQRCIFLLKSDFQENLFKRDLLPLLRSQQWEIRRVRSEATKPPFLKGRFGGNVNMKKDVIVDYIPSLRPSASVVTHLLKVIFACARGG